MRLATFATSDRARSRWAVAPANSDAFIDVSLPLARSGFVVRNVLALVAAGPAAWQAAAAAAEAGTGEPVPEPREYLPPIQPPRDVFAVGANYSEHADEAARLGRLEADLPDAIIFTKALTSLAGHGADVPWRPDLTAELDYEAELGVVIGRGGRSIPEPEALSHVFGYTIVNDISARDVQHSRSGGQWYLGKSMDGFCPVGPWIVTADEIPDPHALHLSLQVNGEQRQSASTGQMTRRIETLIAEISRYVTLLPGDLIATGTPAGVGAAMVPPCFLQDGDRVTVSASGLGTLESTIRRSDA
jgi:2-keto-4-pentenoate hydratase/2-oxohepta-3-ene-1,7-dioic acid hydratase in catechol pathway